MASADRLFENDDGYVPRFATDYLVLLCPR